MGTVFSIEEFSVYDGPGIRTTVFLKGCPLRCSWCHNPEGQSPQPQILRNPNGCMHCGACNCETTRTADHISWSSRAIDLCPNRLFRWSGVEMDPHSLCDRLMKNQLLLAGGGVTFSGGEPLMQHDFLAECLTLLKGKLHTAVQTSGYGSTDSFSQILSLADYFLFDIKLIDPDAHKHYTGVSNEQILRHFEMLTTSGKEFIVRTPLIPGVTDTEENLKQIAALLVQHHVQQIELMPYNPMAGSKYAAAGRQYRPDFDPSVSCQTRAELFEAVGIYPNIL